MALVNLKEILQPAQQEGYAVGSFNLANLNMLRPILSAACEQSSPVIMSVAEVHLKYIDLENAAVLARRAASLSKVPASLHLDHGITFDTIVKAIRNGFTSVMFDGSTLPYEDNVAQTREIVKIAHAVGVSVEAELGHVGGGEGTSGPSEADPSLFTDPDQAADYVSRTGIDALATAFGSVHGPYRGEPQLDFERLKQIREKVSVPLVLHGGSGISDRDFQRCIQIGISKINIFTEMSLAAVEAATQKLRTPVSGLPALQEVIEAQVKDTVIKRMQVFGSSMKASS